MPQSRYTSARPRHAKRTTRFTGVLAAGGLFAPARASVRTTAGLLAALLVAVGLTVGMVVAPASAATLVTLTATTTGTILAGEDASVTLTASGPTGSTTDYYNLAFRYELPTGVSYVAGSAAGASVLTLPDPTQVTVVDSAGPPATTHQVLIWSNIADLLRGDTAGFTFGITPDPAVYPVGATIPGTASVYVQSDPRKLTKFTPSTGAVVAGSFIASDTVSPTATKVSAITVTKTEPSPEHELMRGVQDQSTVYTIATRNTGVADTTGVSLVDYLPAGLEFLGCGAVDNSAFGTEEYPGAGRLGAATGGPDCLTPMLIETVDDRPDFAGQVFTKVTWSLGTLPAGSTRTITYSAGIPLLANTLWPAGLTPAATSGLQGSNLDNNTGASTRQEAPAAAGQTLRNTVTASGTYTGPVASPADAAATSTDSVTVKAMDLSIVKSVSSGEFVSVDTVHFDLLLRAGEYTDDSAMTITDTIPNGLCPIVPASVTITGPRAGSVPVGCAVDGTVTGATVESVVANADGTFTLVMTPNPTGLAANTSHTIGYDAYMSTSYAGDAQDGPTVAGDGFLNTVDIAGTTTDVTTDAGSVPVTDDSSAGLASAAPTISKKVLTRPATGGPAVDCAAANPALYVDEEPIPAQEVGAPAIRAAIPGYLLGDRVCFRLSVDFSASTKTRNAQITDFVPVGTVYEGYALAAGSTVAVTPVAGTEAESSPSPDALPAAWNLGIEEGGTADLYVAKGATVTLFVSAIVTSLSSTTAVDITANLMKYRQEATDGTVLALRDQVDYSVAPATVTLAKSISAVKNAGAMSGSVPAAPNDNVRVREGDEVSYAIDVTNAGVVGDVTDITVWDALPAAYSCATWTVAAINPAGTCLDPADPGYPATSATPAGRSVIVWTVPAPLALQATTRLSYTLVVPAGVSVSTAFVNNASVVAFTTPNTNGGATQYYPKGSLDLAHDVDGNAAPANDSAAVYLPDATVLKTGVTGITATGNNAAVQVVAGELVDYTYSVTVPARTSVFNGLLTDTLPTGLSIPAGTVATATLDGGALPVGFSLDTATGALTFPAAYDNDTATGQVFTVTLPGVLVGVGLSSGTLRNTATFASTATLSGSALPNRTATKSVTVVTPVPTLTKTVDKPVARGGDLVVFTLTAGNSANRPAAYDAHLTDCLPAGLVFDPATGFLSAPVGTVTASTAGTGTGVGGNGCAVGTTRLTWELPGTGTLLSPATTAVTFQALVSPASAGLEAYTNTAFVTASTLDTAGPTPVNDPASERVVTAASSAVVTVQGAVTVKTVLPATATVGGTIDYTVTVTLPQNVNFYDAAIIDTLPVGLTGATATVTCLTASAVDCSADLTGAGAPLTASGQKIGWSLGDVASQPELRYVTVTFTGTVTSASTNVAGTVLKNGALLGWNGTDGTNPTAANASFSRTAASATADITVLEPALSITKSVSNLTPEPGQAFTYTVTAQNANTASTSAAFAVSIVDTIPAGIDPASIVNISNGGVRSGSTITWSVATIAKNASAVLTYDATLAASGTLGTGAIVNTVRIPTYRSLPEGPVDEREYTVNPPTATASVTPDFPRIALAKSASTGTTAYLDTPFGWTLTLTNTGSGTAATVTPTDVLPANWEYLAGTGTVSVSGAPATALPDPTVSTVSGVQTLVWPAFTNVGPAGTIVIRYSAQPAAAATTTPGAGAGILHTNTLTASTTDATGATGRSGPTSYTGSPATASAHLDSADLAIVKAAGAALVAGTTTANAWTLTVSNRGPDTAVGSVAGHNFRVTDTPAAPLPAGLSITAASGVGWSCTVPDASTGAFTCDRLNGAETLAAGSAWPPITVAVTVAADVASGTDVANTASVAALTFDPDTVNNTDAETLSVTTSADLRVEKVSQGLFTAGQVATWTIDVTNDGPSLSVAPIEVTDTLPGNLSEVSVTGTGWTCDTTVTPVSCTTETSLALGDTSRLTVTALIDSGFTGSLTNTAAVTGTTRDLVPANNESETTDPVGTGTTLSIEKSLLDAELVPGAEATYRFLVTNTGTADARMVTVSDVLPAGLAFVGTDAAGPGTWTCTETATAPSTIGCALTGTLAPGAGAAQTIDVTVRVASSLTGEVVNAATVVADNADPVTDDTDTALTGQSDLGIVKSHPDAPVTAGTGVVYTLEVQNHGPSDAPIGTVVTDRVPAGLTPVSADGGSEWTCGLPVGQDLTCTSTGILVAGATAQPILVTVAIPADAGAATFTNVADVTGVLDEPTPDANPNTASDPTVVTDLAEVSIVKALAGESSSVVAGDSISYTLTVTNLGPSFADALTVSDLLPAGFTATAIAGEGWNCTLATVSCSRETLGLTSTVITVTATVSGAIPDETVAVNSATVVWTDSRPEPHSDTDTVPVTLTAVADLVLVKSASTSTVNAGESVDFDLQLTNAGLSDAVGPITVVDTLPVGIRFQANTAGWSCAADAAAADAEQTVTCTLGDGTVGLAAGGTATLLTLTTGTEPALGLVTLTNTATAATPTTETGLDNNTDAASVTVTRLADLGIVKSHTGDGAIGAVTAFRIVVTNAGPSTAVAVTVVDSLPQGLTWVDAAGSDPAWTCTATATTATTAADAAGVGTQVTPVTCALAGDLAAGATAPPLVVNATVDERAYPLVTNVAVVSSETPDPEPADNTATDELPVTPLVTLKVTKAHLGQAQVGQTLDYLISVSNVGATADPGGFSIVDDLPAGLAYEGSEGEDVSCAAVRASVTCVFAGELAIGETRTVTLTTRVLETASPQVVNTVTARSLFTDPASPTPTATDSDTASVQEALAGTGLTRFAPLLALALTVLLLGAGMLVYGRRRRDAGLG